MGELKIVGFICRFCALLNAGLGPPVTGGLRLETVELPCAGRLEAQLILTAFERGADAVFVAGCADRECYNINGSRRAGRRLAHWRRLLDEIGLGGERLVMYKVAGSDGPRLAAIVNEMTALLARLGPSRLNLPRRPAGEGDDDSHDSGGSETAGRNSGHADEGEK